MIYQNLQNAFHHGKRVIGNAYNHAVKYAGQLDQAMNVGRRLYSAIHPLLSRNMNNALMSGISKYDEGRAQVMAQHNNVENHLMRIRRTVPEIGL